MRGAAIRRAGVFLVAGALVSAPLVTAAGAADPAPATAPIVSVGPDAELNCTTASQRSDWLQFFASHNVRPPALSCATVVAVAGFGLFGPTSFAGTDGKVAGTPLHAFVPVGQTSATSGSVQQYVTTVRLPGTGLLLRQTDSYVEGHDSVVTRVEIGNLAPAARDVVVYRTGDCFPGSDAGFGISGGDAVGCEQVVQDGLNAVPVAGPVYMRWTPTRGVSRFDVGAVVDVRAAIASGGSLADSCDCSTPQDIAAALSWSLHIASGAIESVAHRLTYSPAGGRDRTKIAATATVKKGITRLEAHLTSSGRPIAGAPIEFVVGSLPACEAITGRGGTARCKFDGVAPGFAARYRGDARLRPVRARFSPDPLPPPPPDPPGFPACGHFGDDIGVVDGGDTHSEDVAATTVAPPCPIVKFTAYGDGVPIGEKLGDLRATDFFGRPVSGLAVLFIERPFGLVGPSCVYLTATDTRTGQVLDTFPDPASGQHCMVEIAGQKFR